jgi:hypothetical protein
MPTGDPACPQHGMVPCWCGDATRAVTRKCYNCGPGAPRDTDEKWLCARCSGVYMFLPSGKMESIARWQRTTGIPRVESAHRTVDSEGDRLRGPGQRGGTGTFIDGSTRETQGSNADPLHAEGKAESPSVSALLTLQEGLKELTSEDWDVIEDGLSGLQGEADHQADMWRGRGREARYKREAQQAQDVLTKVQALRSALLSSSSDDQPDLPRCVCGGINEQTGQSSCLGHGIAVRKDDQ